MDGPITLEKTLRGSLINEVLAALLGYTGGDAGTVGLLSQDCFVFLKNHI